MNNKLHSEAVDHLFRAILTLKTEEECYRFFEDVCTINELLSGDRREDRSLHGDDQPCEPLSELRK